MQSIRSRLSRNHLLVLALGMTLAAGLTWQVVSNLYIETQRANLLEQARLIAAALQGAALPENSQPYSQAANIAPGIHTRLLTEGGAVAIGLPLVNTAVQMPLAEGTTLVTTAELLQRPEIESALSGSPSTAVRRVLDNRRLLYAAAPIQTDDGRVSGIIYLATPLPGSGLPTDVILQMIGASILAIFLAVLAGRLLARQIARPLEGLAQAASGIAGGDLNARSTTEDHIKELHDLAGTFNHMADSLQQSDQTKKAFIADVAHELRTPLTVIKGTIETLEDGALDDREGRGPLLASMQRETDRLIRLVNELLILTRADAGQLPLELEQVDLVDLARGRCENLNRLAGRSRVQLRMEDLTGGNTHIPADPDRLVQVFDNLLDNAVRHSPQDSMVTVTIREAGGGIECSVSDQGPGISAQHLPYIFERFYRVEKSRDRSSGGTGLGLAIVRALVSAHGGRVSADSAEDKGTTITFWLPHSPSPR
ncbi:MAG: cell wall metabolism sensor histidine kinase WalK [Chloroflexi bacterium]|nr:cell wall metabolism sensor histidine kinase WalK [Chloroflexota bacterium]